MLGISKPLGMRIFSKEQSALTVSNTANPLKRYSYIDSLRGFAIIGVLIAHTGLYGNVAYPSLLRNLAEIDVGPRGVQLFYVVSAFTLCVSFSKRRNIEKHPIRNFYVRRFFRIAPLFYLAIRCHPDCCVKVCSKQKGMEVNLAQSVNLI
jgi:peptidoglycan/LPS O-acetylase OafA/YrhL